MTDIQSFKDELHNRLERVAQTWKGKTLPYPDPDPYELQGQCVQFIRWCLDTVYERPQWPMVRGACDFWKFSQNNSIFKRDWVRIPNTPSLIPQEGDICIWNNLTGKGYGHIGIVFGPEHTVKQFTSLEQNWIPLKVSVTTHNYINVYGFIRMKDLVSGDG